MLGGSCDCASVTGHLLLLLLRCDNDSRRNNLVLGLNSHWMFLVLNNNGRYWCHDDGGSSGVSSGYLLRVMQRRWRSSSDRQKVSLSDSTLVFCLCRRLVIVSTIVALVGKLRI